MGSGIYFRAATPAVVILLLAVLGAAAIQHAAGLDPDGVFLAYLLGFSLLTLVIVILWSAVTYFRLLLRQAPRPLSILQRRLATRLPFIIIPALLSPVFFTAFTISKSGIAYLTGFQWDAWLTEVDRAIFGTDPWVYTHAVLGAQASAILSFVYNAVWYNAYCVVQVLVPLYARARTVAVFFGALYGTWFLGGILAAYSLSSAGPVFAQLSDSALGADFAPLRASLVVLLPPDDPVRLVQEYLLTAEVLSHGVTRGGGISAMPSMHMATVFLFAVLAWRSVFLIPVLGFITVIWVGSVHFGYHYAVDAVPSLLIVLACWKVAEWSYDRLPARAWRQESVTA